MRINLAWKRHGAMEALTTDTGAIVGTIEPTGDGWRADSSTQAQIGTFATAEEARVRVSASLRGLFDVISPASLASGGAR